jgi:hypothetical protein
MRDASADDDADVTGTATITCVGFFDKSHGQGGGAPNGIELHPVLSFSSTACRTGVSARPGAGVRLATAGGRCTGLTPVLAFAGPRFTSDKTSQVQNEATVPAATFAIGAGTSASRR